MKEISQFFEGNFGQNEEKKRIFLFFKVEALHLVLFHLWRHVNYGNTINVFFYFSVKRHKIVEIFELLTTELSSYKMCKVGMLFCTLQA